MSESDPGNELSSVNDSSISAIKHQRLPVQLKRTVLTIISHVIAYDLVELARPKVDSDFGSAPLPIRVLYALKYNIELLDYAVERWGWFRALLVLGLKVCLFIAVPLVCIGALIWLCVPIMIGAADVAESFALMTRSLESAFGSLFRALLYAIGAFILLVILLALVQVWMRQKGSASPARRVDSHVID